ncbi:hypothetical protein Tco_0765632 [Tanacetum coccineum]
MPASMEAHIVEHAVAPIPSTSPTYDQAPLGHRAAMIPESPAVAAARAPRGQYDFVDTVEAGQGLIRSPGHDSRTIARTANRVEDVGYVRRKESEDFYTQLLDARTDRRGIRLEIGVVRGQRTAYEIELHERAEDDAVRQIMRTQVLEARARIDTVEDVGSSCYEMLMHYVMVDFILFILHCVVLIMLVTRQGENDAMTPESIQAMIDRAIQRNSTHTQDDASHNLGGGLRMHVQPARVCSYTDFMKCQPLNFKETEGVVGMSQWLKKIELVFHISGCAIENQMKFTTCILLGAALTITPRVLGQCTTLINH